jgi:hypothetical protein
MPAFASTAAPLSDALRTQMTDVTWREGCPVGLDALAALHVSHWNQEGTVELGLIVVDATVADDVASVFRSLYYARFPITQMRPAAEFGGDDARSMEVDNTSAFNCRPITRGSSFSRHSHGTAIDLNPLRNPYVKGDRVLPPAGREWLERDPSAPGVITEEGPVVAAFRRIGWRWGGAWSSAKDYQHFSTDGR